MSQNIKSNLQLLLQIYKNLKKSVNNKIKKSTLLKKRQEAKDLNKRVEYLVF